MSDLGSSFLAPPQKDALDRLWKRLGLPVVHLDGLVDPDQPLALSHGRVDPTCLEARLLGIAQFLGEVYGFATQEEGALVQQIILDGISPASRQARGVGSRPYATTTAHATCRPDFVLLGCRQGPAAPARAAVVSATDVLDAVSPATASALRQPLFRIRSDPSFGEPAPVARHLSVISGPPDRLTLRLDIEGRLTAIKAHGDAALKELHAVLPSLGTVHLLPPGNVLVIDNRRAAHTIVRPAPGGEVGPLWLQRSLVRRELWSTRALHAAEGVVRPRP